MGVLTCDSCGRPAGLLFQCLGRAPSPEPGILRTASISVCPGCVRAAVRDETAFMEACRLSGVFTAAEMEGRVEDAPGYHA
jgi:hypothetical protein